MTNRKCIGLTGPERRLRETFVAEGGRGEGLTAVCGLDVEVSIEVVARNASRTPVVGVVCEELKKDGACFRRENLAGVMEVARLNISRVGVDLNDKLKKNGTGCWVRSQLVSQMQQTVDGEE